MKTVVLENGVVVKVPAWAKYVAEDETGELWAYECKPVLSSQCACNGHREGDEVIWHDHSTGYAWPVCQLAPNPLWETTLEEV